MSHSSIFPFNIHGQKVYVYCAIGGIVGILAEGENAGEILFESTLWNHNVIAPSPVYLGDGRIFITAGYGGGSMLMNIKNEGGPYIVEALQTLKPDQGLASEQQTPIYHKGHLFAILPKDAGPLRNQLVCTHPDDCSQVVWSSGKSNRFGLGPFLVADDKFFIMSDDGVLTVIEASVSGYNQLARAKVLNGHDAWGPMALVNGRLLARDSRRLVCLDVRARL
jgi:outer membrane protein assembly factor BamB